MRTAATGVAGVGVRVGRAAGTAAGRLGLSVSVTGFELPIELSIEPIEPIEPIELSIELSIDSPVERTCQSPSAVTQTASASASMTVRRVVTRREGGAAGKGSGLDSDSVEWVCLVGIA